MSKKKKTSDSIDSQTFTIDDCEIRGYLEDDNMLIGGGGSWDHIKIELEEKVNHPLHYTQGSVECIDALEAATVNLTGIDAVCTANAIKYMWRWKQKGGLEDLKKAKWYIERLITRWENHEVIY
jgi:hypothetical protein